MLKTARGSFEGCSEFNPILGLTVQFYGKKGVQVRQQPTKQFDRTCALPGSKILKEVGWKTVVEKKFTNFIPIKEALGFVGFDHSKPLAKQPIGKPDPNPQLKVLDDLENLF